MNEMNKKKTMAGILLLLAGVCIAVMMNTSRGARPQPNGKGYFKGAMLNKAGTAYTDDEGHIMPTPPGAPEPKGHIPGGIPEGK